MVSVRVWHDRVRVLLLSMIEVRAFRSDHPSQHGSTYFTGFFITAVATRSQHYLLTSFFLLVFQCNKSYQFVSVTNIVTIGSSTDSGVTFWLSALESNADIVGPLLMSFFLSFSNDMKMSFMDWK